MVKGIDVELGLTWLDGWMTHGTLRGQLARVVHGWQGVSARVVREDMWGVVAHGGSN